MLFIVSLEGTDKCFVYEWLFCGEFSGCDWRVNEMVLFFEVKKWVCYLE